MEFRNAKYINADQTMIDLEYNHPDFGWIPFTASENDVEEHSRELFALASAGTVAPYVPSPSDINAQITTAPEDLTGGPTLKEIFSGN